jgi:hypothetical protein
MDFEEFKVSEPATELFRSLRLSEHLESALDWDDLRERIVRFNGRDEGNFVQIARRRDAVCSSGERVLLHAVLYVTDFAWLADELAEGHVWRIMDDAHDEYRAAVAACIAKRDRRRSE